MPEEDSKECKGHQELQTVLVETEATLNSRPLTFVSSGEIEEPLTPYHLLCGRRLMALPDQEEIEISQLNAEEARGRVALLERLKDHFWIQWSNEYLLELRNPHRVKTREAEGQIVAVGDVVIVHEDGLNRGLWKLGRVESLIKGKDGLVRGAVVKSTTPKKRNPTRLRRPLQRLYPLELGGRSQGDSTEDIQMCLLELSIQRCSPDEKQHAEQTDKGERLWKISCFRNIDS
ncbi:hypothetical protein P5673_032848 [Acropora cervicornis]|uniref:DUF5641 domain-containing protein n=1 Tax=Acropora cervicornis TaxID=6130 RepID=A0AAD9PQN6_ACRCE|nr:hypothetical protein P5673_032848 [Acropora cervicornis]